MEFCFCSDYSITLGTLSWLLIVSGAMFRNDSRGMLSLMMSSRIGSRMGEGFAVGWMLLVSSSFSFST